MHAGSTSPAVRGVTTALLLSSAVAALPVPTAPQLQYQRNGVTALIHFNMATFFRNGDPGCDASNWEGPTGSSNPASFAPTSLNVTQWVDSMKAIGARNAVLTAKHGCGFLLWPTSVKLPDGSPYGYNVNASLNVIQAFQDATTAAGIQHGFYFSLTNNFYLNVLSHSVQPGPLLPGQVNVTQWQFESISLQLLTELWSTAPLGEIWLDGGYTSDLQANITALMSQLQPNAVAFGGEGVSANPLRWCGSEQGSPPGWPNVWGPDCASPPAGESGCPSNTSGAVWSPSACDFTLQAGDTWFYQPGTPLRSVTELINAYNIMVGGNSAMELDFAIDRTGRVHPTHVALYAAFGAWIDSCYGSPVATQSFTMTNVPDSVSFSLPSEATIDRIALEEDITQSQLVTGYTVEVLMNGGYAVFSSGMTIGNKRIDITPTAINVTGIRVNVTSAFAAPTITVSVFAAAPCATPVSRVQYQYGSTGMCLATNASSSFPCAGGSGNSCPLFLAPCGSEATVWNNAEGYVTPSAAYGSSANIDLDCGSCAAHTVLKVLQVDGPFSPIVFNEGQLQLTCPDGVTSMCLNGGQGPITPPCNPNEFYVPTQIQIDDCSSPTTSAWTMTVL